jgi:hypothetical protein
VFGGRGSTFRLQLHLVDELPVLVVRAEM